MSGEKKIAASLKPSIMRLRALRDQLCTKQSDWKSAFEIRDYVLSELRSLHEMLLDNSVARDDCVQKTVGILSTFEAVKSNKDSEE